MGKIPPIAIIIVAVVLVIGISAAAYYLLIQPENKKLAELKTQLEAEQKVAAQADKAKKDLADVTVRLAVGIENLIKVRERKSIHISNYMPILAMTALWYEYRKDLPAVVQQYAAETGCNIETGATIPAPPMTPPSVPPSGFMQVPGGAALNLTISGPLANVERFYRGLARLPRVATLSGLDISGTADRITARIALSLWILVEGEEVAGGGAAPAAPAGGGAPGAGAPPPPAPGGGGGEEEGGGKKGGKKGDDEGGGGKGLKGKKAASGGEGD
jgi:Tfp pilus assembly protein PilO